MGEERVVKKVAERKPDFRRGRPKSQREEHKEAENPQLEGEDPGSEVMEGNHGRSKDEQGIRIGAGESMGEKEKLRRFERKL